MDDMAELSLRLCTHRGDSQPFLGFILPGRRLPASGTEVICLPCPNQGGRKAVSARGSIQVPDANRAPLKSSSASAQTLFRRV